MSAFKAPTGETSSSRIKSLVLHVERTRGAAEANELLQEIGVARDLLADETRPVSIAIWRRALESFARRYGLAEIDETVSSIIASDNLGPWIHIVRKADGVSQAYRLLEGATTQLHLTTRLETRDAGVGVWRGRLHVMHDAALERGGLLSAARRAELAAIPVLFGLPQARVREVSSPEKGDGYYEYEARWQSPTTTPSRPAWQILCIGVGVVIVLAAFGLLQVAVGALALTLVAAGIVRWLASESGRRTQVNAQSMRIRALERSLELQTEPASTAVGQLEGKIIAGLYRLNTRLGTGATGVIYEALRLSDRLPVAVKLLRTAVAEDSVASDRLRREAEALRLTWHSNVVEIFDHGHLPDGSSYIVMELLSGESLATRLARQGRLTPAEIVPILSQLCDALSAVHAAGVIHRDIKPSNVYLCESSATRGPGFSLASRFPDSPRVKLVDFGIARVEWAETRITNMGVPLGTPGYMSPEQEKGEGIDHRSDVFALGAIALECLTGVAPPLLGNRTRTASQPTEGAGGATIEGVSALDERWRSLIQQAMAIDPRDRFADARAFASAVEAIALAESGKIAKATKAMA